MKRKRGHKKGKPKGPPLAAANEATLNVVSVNTEDNSGLDEFDNNDEHESGMEVDTPSSTGTDQPLNLANINPDGSIDKTTGKSVGRVKVKLRTSKMLESQRTSSDVPSQSDTDKSSPQFGLEKQGVVTDKMDDSANSLPEMKMGVLGNVSKKAGSIRIKSSRVLGCSSVNKSANSVLSQGESQHEKEPKMPHQDSRYNKQELDAALMMIKKVMKMDAAEPFNVPVNPEALGIPDYFDVIDTPMDFGTICSNLENGDKYMNSGDVYKDVQYIWENCYKYNNKGDYILDLMRRVKKNFMKYWTAAGLYTEQSRGTNGIDSIQVEDVEPSSQGKVHVKGSQSKQKTKKRHGRRHKSDCLCAICVLKRRRKEREENARIAKGQIGVIDNNLAQEFKQEESSLVESPCGEDSSSNVGESLDPDTEADVERTGEEVKQEVTEQQYSPMEEEEEEDEEEEENELDIQKKSESGTPEQLHIHGRLGDEPIRESHQGIVEKAGAGIQTHKGDTLVRHEEETAAVQQHKHKESQERQQKAKMYENFRYENPMLLSLCGILFPDNHKSVWSGSHSLVQHQGSAHTARTSAIHKAVETFMK